jgi:methylated-DNA-[protein]-cysteine S-methyltransferase
MFSAIKGLNPSQRVRSTAADDQKQISIQAFETNLGWMAVAWDGELLKGIVFGYASRHLAELAIARQPRLPRPHYRIVGASQVEEAPAWVRNLIEQLRLYADGQQVDFSNVPLDLDHLTSFGKHVVDACRRIGWGCVRTYGDLAAECGSSGAARAVGSVMAKNRFPLVVPCHRVLAAGGALGGYSAPDGLAMKRRLLVLEGAAHLS